MGLLSDSVTLYKREMLIFKANLRTNLVRAAIFPLFIILLFGYLGSGVSNIPVVVVNYANNPQSLQFIESLSTQSLMVVHSVTTQSQALILVNAGTVDFAIIILPNFPSQNGQTAVQVYYTNVQYTVTSAILPAIQQRVAQFGSPKSFQSEFYEPAGSSGGSTVTTPVNGASGSYKTFLFSGVIGMVIVFSALFGGGISIITDRLGGNIKAFLITPINKGSILVGRVFAGMVQSLLFILVVLVIGVADGSSIAMGLAGLAWIFILGVLLMISFTSVAAIIASRMKNINAYAIFSQAIGLPLWFISGGIIPVSSFPPVLQAMSIFDPMTYALDGFRHVILLGSYPIASILVDVSVLAVFGIATTALSIFLFKSTVD